LGADAVSAPVESLGLGPSAETSSCFGAEAVSAAAESLDLGSAAEGPS
jgi:hypothetical protein